MPALQDQGTAQPDQETILRVRNHRLVIPPGAVLEPIDVVMLEPESEHIEVSIEPDLVLRRPATLELSYQQRRRKGESTDDLHIFQIKPLTEEVLDMPPSENPHHPHQQRVEAQLWHFSGYVIGSGRIES